MKIPIGRYYQLLKQYLKPQWPRVVLLFALLLLTIGLRVLNPQIIRTFIDRATGGTPISDLTFLALTFLGFSLLIQIVSVTSTYIGENIGWTATNNLRADMALHALKLDMSYHNDHTPGDMIERIDGDVVDLAIFFSQFVIKIVGNLLLLGGVLLALYLTDWRIGIALTFYAVISLYGLNKLRSIAVPYWKAARDASSDLYGFLEEQLSGTEDIRSSGAVPNSMRHLYRYARDHLQKQRKAGTMNIRLIQMWIGLYEAGRAIAFIGGFYLFTRDAITLGMAYLIVNYTDAIFRPLREITNEIQNLQKAGGSIERIEELYAVQDKIKDTGTTPLPEGVLSVEFDAVDFSYNGDDRILDQVSFHLKPGEVLGLLGRTGSGKTTITRLLFRLYEINSGSLRLNGIDIRDIPISSLQRHVGMVTQDVQLFRATVRDNLTFFDRSISDERILSVIDDLELNNWFNGLPEGLDTELESGGKGLSAGEAQLLAFARVFLKNPGLVILDEASSRLDPATEQRIERAVDKLLQNRTGIIVAHRLKTVERADQIMILENGVVREHGRYQELVATDDSRFAQLLRTGLQEVLA
ncbi:MAG: ABC transporter ATP-binding protein [bacterium]|nr:ABC transporter ATP-binding protein [bacterium]